MTPDQYPPSLAPRLMKDYRPPEGPLVELYRDEDLLFVDKPADLLSVRGRRADHWDCLEYRVRQAHPTALLIHRLDLGTSGVMVFALNHRAQKLINQQFERRRVAKTYVARVAGVPWAETGRIDLPLASDWPRRPMQKVCWERGKPSRTRWQVLAREGEATRLKLHPETGRSHQLRVHLKEIGHPIIGDAFYAPDEIYEAAPRMHLHALTLTLRHPEDGREVRIEAPCPF